MKDHDFTAGIMSVELFGKDEKTEADFLQDLINNMVPVELVSIEGNCYTANIIAFDKKTVIVSHSGSQSLFYKHALLSIRPQLPASPLFAEDANNSGLSLERGAKNPSYYS